MQFTNPIWLWALTGLTIPVGIHLLSRREGKTILIGSLRYLRESPTAQFRHIRLNEIALLILRCVMLILIVSLLAGLTFRLGEYGNKKWLIIEKEIENSTRYKPVIDSLKKQGFEVRLLGAGFPLTKDSLHLQPLSDYWAMTEKLAAMDLDSVIVISFSYQKKFPGERIPLPAHVSWLTEEPVSKNFLVTSTPLGNDSVWTRTGYTSSEVTKFKTQKEYSPPPKETPVSSADTIHISVVADEEFRYDEKIVKATINAIQTITPHRLMVSSKTESKPDPTDSSWVIWLSEKPCPYDSKKNISFVDCQLHTLPLLTEADRARAFCSDKPASGWAITQRLHEGIALKQNFAIRLAAILLPEADRANVTDHRVLPEHQLWSGTNKNPGTMVVRAELSDTTEAIIVLLVVLTLISERILAYQRKQ